MKEIIRAVLLFSAIIGLVAEGRAATIEYDLEIGWQEITINNRTAEGMTINGGIPGPTLYFTEGDLARIRVHNNMDVSTSIHWHGLLVPPAMDGVPTITQPAIKPGATFTYEIPIRQSGTYWYHSHSGLQEQRGLYGSIVIAPRQEQIRVDHDRVVLFSDWTTDSPAYVLKTLKRGSEWYGLEKGSAQSIFGAIKAGRLGDYYRRELQRMPPMDIADVAYDYFLANGKPETAIVAKPGELLRLRIINGSATTYFHLEFAGGMMTIISADGMAVEPLAQKRFLIGVAETYDVLLTVPESGAHELRATAHDGSAHTSVWIGAGMKHPAEMVPKPDVYRSMHLAGLSSMFALTPAGTMGMSNQKVEQGVFDQPGMAGMGGGNGHTMATDGEMGMPGDDRRGMEMGGAAMVMEKSAMATMGDEAPSPVMGGKMPVAADSSMVMSRAMASSAPEMVGGTVGHNSKEMLLTGGRSYGKRFGLLAADSSSRGHLAPDGGSARPWTPYADLRSPEVTSLPEGRELREIRLTLDGDMERYVWLLNNRPLSETDHILIKAGEVVRLIMINRTMMHHPMHLHGHFFRVLNGQGEHAPLKHTVNVAPMSTTVIEFYADEVGDWFFHCHLLYHMKAGMARLVHYQNFTPAEDVQAVRAKLYKDPWYFQGDAEILGNMTEGKLVLANTRVMAEISWEAGWHEVVEEEWEAIGKVGWYFNRFTTLFVGGRSEGVRSDEHESVGIFGLSYLLPLNIESAAWLDSEGESRVILAKEFELTPRISLHGETEYDSREHWEGGVALQYKLTRHVSLAGKWHSEFGYGGGLQISF